jgi:hypothetical protein
MTGPPALESFTDGHESLPSPGLERRTTIPASDTSLACQVHRATRRLLTSVVDGATWAVL